MIKKSVKNLNDVPYEKPEKKTVEKKNKNLESNITKPGIKNLNEKCNSCSKCKCK